MTNTSNQERVAFVHQAELMMDESADTAAPGGAVTTALCGHWEHDGACRWPHNNAIDTGVTPARFRTLFVSGPADEPEIRERIERVLRQGAGWSVVSSGARPLVVGEEVLAQRLRAGGSSRSCLRW